MQKTNLRQGSGWQACANSWCNTPFEITEEDQALLSKVTPVFNGVEFPIPPQTLCFHCRLQRRLAFYNTRTLYKRTCDLTGKEIVSIYSPESPMTVYDREQWYKDDWDPMEYRRDFDFSRPFFTQFWDLMKSVPVSSRAVLGFNENSDYTNDNWKLKNCYMVFDCEKSENCFYGHTFINIKDSMDFLVLTDSELCYECTNCNTCYGLKHSIFCNNCSNSWFLRDCNGCANCFGCANLRQKQYCIWNEQKTRDEYEAFLDGIHTMSWSQVQSLRMQAEEFFLSHPVKPHRGEQNIDCTGDNVHNSKDSKNCFDSLGMEDCVNMTNCLKSKDCGDIHNWGNGMELSYNGVVVGSNSKHVICGYYVTEGASDIFYSTFCSRNSHDLFGCVGLRHKEYCIFNKQYTKDEYHALAKKIAQHMLKTGEWGMYFPPEISMFGYNESYANVVYPLEKKAALGNGWKWSDYEAKVPATKTISPDRLPDSTSDVPDDVLNWAIICEVTGKPFKIVKQELQFYRDHKLPLPRRHPNQRHFDRFKKKNSFTFHSRNCAKCNRVLETSYAPERPETVFCEECYLKEVY